MYSKGVPTRKMTEVLEELFHNRYSESTISRIIAITVPEISKWVSRPLEKDTSPYFHGCNVLLSREWCKKNVTYLQWEYGNQETMKSLDFT